MREKKIHNFAIDLLRTFAILAVILIHTTTRSLEASHYDIISIPFTLFLNQAARFAVPLFFLISGFVLELNYKEINYVLYFKKRTVRILVPFLAWSTFYYLAYPLARVPKESLIQMFLNGDASYQLYFIPTLIIFYLLFPFLHHMYNLLAKIPVVFFLTAIEIAFLTKDYYFHPVTIETPLRVALLNYQVFFFGMIASHHREEIIHNVKKFFWIILVITIILMYEVYLESQWYYLDTKNLDAIYLQFRPSVFFYTLFLFSLFLFVFRNTQKEIFKKIVTVLSRLSFFVFFVHIAILYFFWYNIGIKLFPLTRNTFLLRIGYELFFFLFVASISFLLAAIIHKIPKLKFLTG